MKSLIITLCGIALSAGMAGAQTSPSTTTTTTASSPAGATSTSTSTTTTTSSTENIGTVREFTPGSVIVLNSGSGEPVRYKLGSSVTYINGKGKEIKAERIRKDRKVRVHYTKQGNDMIVDKVTIVRD